MKFNYVTSSADDVTGQSRRHPTDHELSALASIHRKLHTKKHARLVLRHNGFSGKDANIDALVSRIAAIKRANVNRASRRIEQRLGSMPRYTGGPSGRPAILLPVGTVAQRLELLRYKNVVDTAKECLRHGAAGGSSFRVSLTRVPKQVGYEVVMDSNRDTYGGSYKGWSASEDHHRICVPVDWRVRVQERGFAVAGSMMTLDLQPLVGHGDIELFQAAWVSQSRGYGVAVHRGVIARLGDEVFHAPDAEQAIRGVTLKVRRATSPRRLPLSGYELSVDGFAKRYARYGDVQVNIRDAREIGACEYGIESWCNAVGIDVSQKSAELSRILDGFRHQPQVEVRRTVLHAIKRNRAAAR